MGWRRAEFKGQKVWAEVDAAGKPVEKSGLVQIRYDRRPDAKIYSGGKSKLVIDPEAPIEMLDAADPVKTARRGTKSSGFGSAGTRTARQAALAQEAAEQLIHSLSGAVLVFADGSCRGNPGPAGAGVAIRMPDGKKLEASLSLGRGTNNIAELSAIELALDLLERAQVDRTAKVALFTDSAYAHGVLVKAWKAKANRELIEALRSRLARWKNLEIFWVAGHVGIEGNERADALANYGVDGVSATYEG